MSLASCLMSSVCRVCALFMGTVSVLGWATASFEIMEVKWLLQKGG